MWGILRNDYYTCKKEAMISLISIIVYGLLICIKVPSAALEEALVVSLLNACYFFLTYTLFIFFGTLIGTVIRKNEQPMWKNLVATTKLGQKGYITQRYIFAVAVYVLAWAYARILNIITYKVNGVQVSKSFINAFFVFFVFQAIFELPCMLRFGTVFGTYIKIIFGFAIIFGLIIYGLYGNVPIFSEKNQDKMFEWVFRMVSEGLNGPTAKKAIAIWTVVTAVLYAVSYKVALLTRKRA